MMPVCRYRAFNRIRIYFVRFFKKGRSFLYSFVFYIFEALHETSAWAKGKD